jgi:hypothetical protein
MRGRSLLAACDIGMVPAYFLATLPAIPNLHRITPHFRHRLGRYICDRNDFPPRLSQSPTAIRTATRSDRHIHCFCIRRLRRFIAKPKKALTGLASRRLGIGLARAFGKRRSAAPPFQLLDLRPQLLDHSMLIQNDLQQLLAAQRFQVVQDPGCTILPVRARTLKSGNNKSRQIRRRTSTRIA